MNVVFLGTPDFAVLPLRAINDSRHKILAVITQPARPVGRKAVITPCAVETEGASFFPQPAKSPAQRLTAASSAVHFFQTLIPAPLPPQR